MGGSHSKNSSPAPMDGASTVAPPKEQGSPVTSPSETSETVVHEPCVEDAAKQASRLSEHGLEEVHITSDSNWRPMQSGIPADGTNGEQCGTLVYDNIVTGDPSKVVIGIGNTGGRKTGGRVSGNRVMR
ncbi:hypothetical protein J5N97_021403 [Dioscorea zingiberensis]|uniref:Uncharacterized protein n=1 Tax=Dioscorea zingiberensis TaxID=325984 RepID=A0A9D5HEB3_9LILI|nr:hypothetical protein J5N97_021403 [Dioscorea zingiberensis]